MRSPSSLYAQWSTNTWNFFKGPPHTFTLVQMKSSTWRHAKTVSTSLRKPGKPLFMLSLSGKCANTFRRTTPARKSCFGMTCTGTGHTRTSKDSRSKESKLCSLVSGPTVANQMCSIRPWRLSRWTTFAWSSKRSGQPLVSEELHLLIKLWWTYKIDSTTTNCGSIRSIPVHAARMPSKALYWQVGPASAMKRSSVSSSVCQYLPFHCAWQWLKNRIWTSVSFTRRW